MLSPSSSKTVLLLALFCIPPSPAPTSAQEEVIPLLMGEARVGDRPLSEGFVVLHRVSEESSGEIDSVRVEPDGSFRLRLPHVPDHASRPEIFFASVQYRGLLYFGPAVTEAFQLDSLYLIQAYDTLSVPPGGAQVPLAARNYYLEPTENGWTVTDVFQLTVEGDRTLYSPEEGVVWSYPLPESASDFEVGQADMAPDAIRFDSGRVEVFSPLPPGERYVMIGYRLPGLDATIPMPGRTDHMEVLVREPAPNVDFLPLSLSDAVEISPGNTFRRFVGDGFLDGEVRGLVAPEPWSLPAEWLGLLMAGLLGAAGVFSYRRRAKSGGSQAPPSAGPTRDQTLLSIAKLEEEFQSMVSPSEEARVVYHSERERLLKLLKRLS